MGNASVDVKVDNEGHFTGSRGSWFVPLQDNDRYLTWSQLGLTQQDNGLVSNVGVGQRWARGNWLVGYNTFYDNLLDENLQRAGFGAEAWGEYLRLSANFYQPFAAWHEQTATQEQRMARGYDLTARMRMPFYQHLNTSVSLEQYFGDRVDLFNSGTGYHNPVALSLGLNYTPVPLVTVTAQHKQGESGENQNNLGLNLNYRFGVPLKNNFLRARLPKVSRYVVVAMTIRSEIIYRLLSTDSENVNGVSGDTAVGSKTWRNSAAEITNPQSLRYSATDLAGRYADIKFDAGRTSQQRGGLDADHA